MQRYNEATKLAKLENQKMSNLKEYRMIGIKSANSL